MLHVVGAGRELPRDRKKSSITSEIATNHDCRTVHVWHWNGGCSERCFRDFHLNLASEERSNNFELSVARSCNATNEGGACDVRE